MTNLLATIIVSIAASIMSGLETNKTESFPTHIVNMPCPEGRPGCLVFHGRYEPDANPKSKTVTTKVELVKRLQFEWEGQARVVESRELISQKVQIFGIKEAWEKEGGEQDVTPNDWNSKSNSIAIPWRSLPILLSTNIIYRWTITNSILSTTMSNDVWTAITNK